MGRLCYTFVADGSIRSERGLLVVGAFEFGQDGTGNMEARNHVTLREFKTKTLGVVVDDINIGQLQRKESLIAAGKSRLSRNSVFHLGGHGGASAQVVVSSSGDSSSTRSVEKGVGSSLGWCLSRISASLLKTR